MKSFNVPCLKSVFLLFLVGWKKSGSRTKHAGSARLPVPEEGSPVGWVWGRPPAVPDREMWWGRRDPSLKREDDIFKQSTCMRVRGRHFQAIYMYESQRTTFSSNLHVWESEEDIFKQSTCMRVRGRHFQAIYMYESQRTTFSSNLHIWESEDDIFKQFTYMRVTIWQSSTYVLNMWQVLT